MKTTTVTPDAFSRTFTMIARPDTHFFMEEDLPRFLDDIASVGYVRFRNYVARVRSGEYIKKDYYADAETDYVYLRVGQFSGTEIDYNDLVFLEPAIGKKYEQIAVQSNSIIITRSGTVGVVHRFIPPDGKIYIPSHHLAVVEVPDDANHSPEYLRLFLQTEFARKFFWAFASGKDQKEISNWSIKSIPIPQCPNPDAVVSACSQIEERIAELQSQIELQRAQKADVLLQAVQQDVCASG